MVYQKIPTWVKIIFTFPLLSIFQYHIFVSIFNLLIVTTMNHYAILKENNPRAYWGKESAIRKNDFKPTKYLVIVKDTRDDGNEPIVYIEYSDDLAKLQALAKTYPEYWDYVAGQYRINNKIFNLP